MKKVIAGLEESITKGTIPNRGDLLCLNASLAPGVCPQGMSHLWNYTVSTVGSVWSPLHHLFLREEVISIHSGVMPLLVRDSSAHTDMTHLYTQVMCLICAHTSDSSVHTTGFWRLICTHL